MTAILHGSSQDRCGNYLNSQQVYKISSHHRPTSCQLIIDLSKKMCHKIILFEKILPALIKS